MNIKPLSSSFSERIFAFLIDLTILTTIMLLVSFVSIVPYMLTLSKGDDARLLLALFYSILAISYVVFMFKDSKEGQSIGKRIMKIQIKCATNTDELPAKGNLILRNTTLILWFVEAIILLIFKKRVGDMIFSTYVEKKTV